jgi:hypothetical protein
VNDAAEALGASPSELDTLAAEGDDILDAPDLLESLRERSSPALPDGPAGAVWRTLLDALSVCTADAVERVAGLLGPPARLVVFGGGAGSEPWLAAKAARLDVPVWRTGAGEAVARGAAVLGGVAAGWWPSPGEAPAPSLRSGTEPALRSGTEPALRSGTEPALRSGTEPGLEAQRPG